MSCDPKLVARTLEKFRPLDVTARPMFGEYGMYFMGKFFGLIVDDVLFVKMTDAGREVAGRIATSAPYPGAKPALRISSAKMNDRRWLTLLVEVTTNALPEPKKKKSQRV